jgi:hypothetical protein
MKFGKQLARVVDSSDPEWAPYWINYKLLKKKLKELPRGCFPAKNNQPVAIVGDAGSQPQLVGGMPADSKIAAGPRAPSQSKENAAGTCCGVAGCSGSNGMRQQAPGGFNANEQISALSR